MGRVAQNLQLKMHKQSTECFWSDEIQQKVFPIFDLIILHAYLTRGLQKYARILIPTMAF